MTVARVSNCLLVICLLIHHLPCDPHRRLRSETCTLQIVLETHKQWRVSHQEFFVTLFSRVGQGNFVHCFIYKAFIGSKSTRMKQKETEKFEDSIVSPSSFRTQNSTIQIRLTCMMMCWRLPHSLQMTEAVALNHPLLFARSHLPNQTTRPLQSCIHTVACGVDEQLSM